MTTTAAVRLLINCLWYRTLALIWWVYSGGPFLKASSTPSSHATRLPFELVEIIIAHLLYDMCSLRACTLTCYSWYIAAVPHLHHTLVVSTFSLAKERYIWPLPLIKKKRLGLLLLVKTLWIYGDIYDVAFSHSLWPTFHNLLPYFPFTSVSQLRIDHLDIPSFLPRVRRSFMYFLPTLRGLALKEPKGSRREVIYFIGLFKHLHDLKHLHGYTNSPEGSAGDMTLVPSFVPPLRGLLTMRHPRVGLLKDMIDLFGGFRFRHMDLFGVDGNGTRLLLDAGAKTLESVMLHPSDPHSEQLPLNGTQVQANDFTARYSIRNFDLSRNESLRTLKIPASPIDHPLGDVSHTGTFLKHILSTITSPSFSEVVVLYRDRDFPGAESWSSGQPPFRHESSKAERAGEAAGHCWGFEVLREVQKVRPLQLVLCASIWGCVGEHPVQLLEEAVAEEKAKGLFGNGFSDPIVVYSPRRTCDNI